MPRLPSESWEITAMTDALIEKSGGLPVCEFHPNPQPGTMAITVWGTKDELSEWGLLIVEHQPN